MSALWRDVTEAIVSVPAFPSLWIPHCIVMCLVLRGTLGQGQQALHFARRHPLACYMLALIYTFSGAMVGLLLRAQPILTVLTWTNNVTSFTVVWYLMFFGPRDLPHRALTAVPVAPLLVAAQDWLRLLSARRGVQAILAEHPLSFLYPVVFASLASNGFLFVKYIEKLLLGGPSKAFVIPHHATKTMVLTAILLTAQAQGFLPMVGAEDLFSYIVLLTVSLRLVTSFLLKDWDPYSSLESQACSLLYGAPGTQEEEGEEIKKKE